MNGRDEHPPFMGWFLAWVANLPMPIHFVLSGIGAVAGFLYGLQQPHHAQYFYAIVGGTIGLIAIMMIALAIRFVIQLILIGLIGLAVYYAFIKP